MIQAGATILRHTGASHTSSTNKTASQVFRLQDGSFLQADWYIAALPLHQLTPLIPERWLTRYAYFQQLAELESIDSTILHVHVEQPCATPRLVLLSDTSFHSVLVTPLKLLIAQASRSSRPTINSHRIDRTHILMSAIPNLLKSWGLIASERQNYVNL